MTVKEALIGMLQRSGYDTVTACEIASEMVAEARTLAPGGTVTLTAPNGETVTVRKRNPEAERIAHDMGYAGSRDYQQDMED